MKKDTIKVMGVDYIVRTLDIRTIPGYEDYLPKEVDVAGEELWDAVGGAISAGDYDACEIDSQIFFYVPDEMLRRDATDEELINYIKENLK